MTGPFPFQDFLKPTLNLLGIACTTLDSAELSFDDLENFLKEATIMIDFRHENVLSLIGVIWEENDKPSVVLPLMENGDVRTLLKDESKVSMLSNTTTPSALPPSLLPPITAYRHLPQLSLPFPLTLPAYCRRRLLPPPTAAV